MKKLSILFVAFLSLLLPLKVFAATDVTLKDNSTTSIKSVSLSVDSATEKLKSFEVSVKTSSDVKISEVNTGTFVCDTFNYVENADGITVTCEMETEAVLSGVLANIVFTSESSDYTFTVVEDATLGNIVNIGTLEENNANIAETAVEKDIALVTAQQESTTTTNTKLFSIESLTEYLPYILIAGSVILLISIIGILLSKKKDTSDEDTFVPQTTVPASDTQPTGLDTVSESISSAPVQSPSSEPTLKDIINNQSEVTSTVQAPESVPPMDQSLESPMTSAPVVENSFVPPVANVSEEQDLQDIMNSESPNLQNSSAPMQENTVPEVPVTSNVGMEVPVTSEAPITMNPVDATPLESIMPESTPMATPEELQKSIDEQISQLGGVTPTPVQDTASEDLPPVPPTM